MIFAETSFLISYYGDDVNSEAAEEISAKHTETRGHRAYDILQVAAAKLLGVTDFWSFDGKQRALAQAEGLKVGP